jgi:hypothetical protein
MAQASSLTSIEPPPQNGASRNFGPQRRRRALELLEQGLWVTDHKTYATRPSAAWKATSLIDALTAHSDLERADLRRKTWRVGPSKWRWAVTKRRKE